MKHNFEESMNSAKKVTLSKKEKDVLRGRLQSFIKENPLPGSLSQTSIPSPYSWVLLMRSHMLVTAFAVLFFVSGASSILAESALPGSTLYGLKTGVNEKVLGWFANSPSAKAEWQLTLADRRLSESEQLAKENKLTPEESDKLQAAFNEHTRLALGTDDADSLDVPVKISPLMASATSSSTSSSSSIASANFRIASSFSKKGKKKAAATTTPVVHISSDEIGALHTQVITKKIEVEADKNTLVKQNQFVRMKGRTLVAEKLLMNARQALKEGKAGEADEFYKQAQTSFGMTASPENNVPAVGEVKGDTSIEEKAPVTIPTVTPTLTPKEL